MVQWRSGYSYLTTPRSLVRSRAQVTICVVLHDYVGFLGVVQFPLTFQVDCNTKLPLGVRACGALRQTGVPSRVYSHLLHSVSRVGSVSTDQEKAVTELMKKICCTVVNILLM